MTLKQINATKKITSFHPPQRTLMGPGPTEIQPRVLTTMSQPAIGYLDPIFVEMMEELKSLLRYVYQTKNALTFPLSGPGSVGMEFCFVNMVAPGDKVIVCIENVERCGAIPIIVDDAWGQPVDPQKVEDAFKKNPGVKILAFVHAETSTGAQSDARALAQIAHRHHAMVIVDAVTSLGGTPVRVDDWGLDAIYSASQKCLSCTPGLSPVSFSERVVEHVKKRKDKIHSWFMDMNLLASYWGATNRTYHHTAPTNSLFALHEALLLIKEEGLDGSWARHRRHHVALKAGLEAMGLKFLVEEPYRRGRRRGGRAPHALERVQPRDRRGPGSAQGQDLALRPHGVLMPARQCDALPVRAGVGAHGHEAADPRRRGRSRGPPSLRNTARRRRTTRTEENRDARVMTG